eukprot:PhM_4_TR8887/c0_g1_i2/m.14154
MSTCSGLSVFGLTGYMYAPENAAEVAAARGSSLNGWIGITDEATEGDWRFCPLCGPVSGQPVVYTDWKPPHEPSNSGMYGVENQARDNGTAWYDASGEDETHPIICEFGGTTSTKNFRGRTQLDLAHAPKIYQDSSHSFNATLRQPEARNRNIAIFGTDIVNFNPLDL